MMAMHKRTQEDSAEEGPRRTGARQFDSVPTQAIIASKDWVLNLGYFAFLALEKHKRACFHDAARRKGIKSTAALTQESQGRSSHRAP